MKMDMYICVAGLVTVPAITLRLCHLVSLYMLCRYNNLFWTSRQSLKVFLFPTLAGLVIITTFVVTTKYSGTSLLRTFWDHCCSIDYRGFPLSEVNNVLTRPVGTKIFVLITEVFSIVSLIRGVC